MRRLALKSLQEWRRRKIRVPLLIRGARQVGKTWLIREFGKSFPSFVELNLEASQEYHQPFKDLFGRPKELVQAVSLLSGKKITPGETLVFLDEIQESKEALLSLRYFKEELPELHVIAAGSLLEFTIKELSFPVGRIEFFHLFPLNFEEYLNATGREDLIDAIINADSLNPLPTAVHHLLLENVANYCLTGGMPEVVATFIETKDLAECQNIQQRLIANFREDFHKYSTRSNVELLRKVFDGIPRLLGQKFKYSNIDRDVRSRELGAALNLLTEAGLAYKVFHSSAQGFPLAAQTKKSMFKVYFLDIGLAQRILGLNISQLFLERKTLLANRGQIAEQFVAQEFLSQTKINTAPQICYWHRETKSSSAEVDFVIESGSSIIPVEVKSGEGSKTKSLRLFIEERGELIQSAIKISLENFQHKDWLKTLPFYAILKIGQEK